MQKFLFILTLLINQLAFSQEREGSICGKVLDNTGQPAPYAAVMLMQGETVVNGAYTDEEGYYLIDSVKADTYNIKVQVLDEIAVVKHILLMENEHKIVDVLFKERIREPIICSFPCWKREPFRKNQPSHIIVIDDEIQKMADRKLSAPASLATGVYIPIK